MGWGNRLRRQKRTGSADLHLLRPKKRTKTCEDLLEGLESQDKLRRRPEPSTSARGTLFSPLLRTPHKYNFSHPKAIKFPFSPWRTSSPNSPDITSPCLLRSLPTPHSSSPLLRNDIHPSPITSRLNSVPAVETTCDLTSATSLARESSLEESPTTNLPEAGMEEEVGVVLEEERGMVLNNRIPAYLQCVKKMNGIGTKSCREAVVSGWVSDTISSSSPSAPVWCEDSAMAEEHQEESRRCGMDGSRYPHSSYDSGKDSSVHSVPETIVEYKHREYGDAHYSATLGMSTLDLSRRTLRDHQHKGVSFTSNVLSFKPASAPTGGPEWMDGDRLEEGSDLGGLHYNPTSLSACLGITSLQANTRAAGERRMNCRNRTRQKYSPLRANLKENQSAVYTRDSTSCDYDVKSYNFGRPPLNLPGGSTGGLGGGVAMGNGSVRDGLPQQSLRFNNSSWGRQSETGLDSSTLVNDGDNLSRRALPYVVDRSGGLRARCSVEHMPMSSASSAPLYANFHCPLKRATGTNVAMEECIL